MDLRTLPLCVSCVLAAVVAVGLTLIAVAQCDECDNCDTCDATQSAECFADNGNSNNDPCSRTGFTPGEVADCNEDVCACPFPPDNETVMECCGELQDECEEVAASICYQELLISADEVVVDQERELKLEIYFPPDVEESVPPTVTRGAVVLGSAGGGTTFFSDSMVVPFHQEDCDGVGIAFNANLASIGFTVVDRAWEKTGGGWTEDDAVPTRIEASRYPALVKYVWDNYFCPGDGGAFVAAGISGGSAEIAFGLSSYGLEDYIDVALLMSGPANADLELTCDQSDPDWCESLWENTCPFTEWSWCGSPPCDPPMPTCVFDVTVDEERYVEVCLTGHCTEGTPPNEEGFCLRQQSILFDPEACEEYEGTITIFAEGGMDGSNDAFQVGPTGALALYTNLCSRKSMFVLDDMEHLFQREEAGRQWILWAIDYYTRPFVGDVNRDGVIDCDDETIICDEIDEECQGYCCQGDVNNDLVVDEDDLDIMQANAMKNYKTFSTGSGNCLDNLPDTTSCLAQPCCDANCPDTYPTTPSCGTEDPCTCYDACGEGMCGDEDPQCTNQ